MREYIKAIKYLAQDKNYSGALMLIVYGIRFVFRCINHFIFPRRCPDCNGNMELFFMRSETNVLTGEDSPFDIDLCDWRICQCEQCLKAEKL